MRIGYFLSSEERTAPELVELAARGEAAGFPCAWISDHYHPWTDSQGQSPFVWTVLGGIAHATRALRVTTAVTCPTVRIHPAVIAQAAATTAMLMPGRFALGVGSGEALNEHVLGDRWPRAEIRLEMLEEAVEVIRALWTGKVVNHRGRHYEVETPASTRGPPSRPRSTSRASGRRRSRSPAGRRRLREHLAGRGHARPYRKAGGRGPAQARDEGLLGPERGRGAAHGAPHVAERGAARRARPGPPHARALRAGAPRS